MDENMTEEMAAEMAEERASGPNDTITLAMVRAGRGYYQYDQYNVVSKGVKVVQEALHMYGFNLSADGKFGSTTKAVVTGFQLENGLTQNGFVNQETLLKLEAWCGTLYETQPLQPAVKQIQYGLATLSSGDSGDAVILVRSLLKQHGYTCDASGSYNSALETVVKKFQQDKGIAVTGNVNQETLAVLQDLTADTAWLNGSTVSLTPGKLARAGFFGILIKPEVVADINNGLNKYGITTGEKVLHFLAQMMEETRESTNIMEDNYRPGEGYVGEKKPYSPYCGAGVLQMSWDYNYKAFSEHVNKSTNGYPEDLNIYPGQLKGNGMYATQHVALKYPGKSSAWFWDRGKMINDLDWSQSAKEISYAVTKKIYNENASIAVLDKRYQKYQEISAILKYK